MPNMRWGVRVDRDRCMGTGNCVFYAPDVFDLNDDGIAAVIVRADPADESVRLAVDACPTRALSLLDLEQPGEEE